MLNKKFPYLWITLLAFVAVGLRNFEPGLSTDGPLYAAISRQIARSGEYFFLYGGTPDFNPFTEHPHLVFWIQSLFFHVLPDQDWAVRIPNHLFYLGFLFLFFRNLRRFFSDESAVLGIFILWTLPKFSNWFSTTYLDPACLFFGFLSIHFLLLKKPFAAGLSLALAIASKGLAAIGFVPALAYIAVREGRLDRKYYLKAILGLCLPLFVYFLMIRQSTVPDFFERYWQRQVSSRFQARFDWEPVFRKEFWTSLLKDSQGTLVFLPLLLWQQRKQILMHSALASFWILFVSYTVLLASKNRIGGQYWLMVFPWICALCAIGLFQWKPSWCSLKKEIFVKTIAVIAVAMIALAQFLPIRTHNFEINQELKQLRKFSDQGFQKVLYDSPDEYPDFLVASPMSWYGNVDVEYCSRKTCPVPASAPAQIFLLRNPDPARIQELSKNHWCEQPSVPPSNLLFFTPCDGIR